MPEYKSSAVVTMGCYKYSTHIFVNEEHGILLFDKKVKIPWFTFPFPNPKFIIDIFGQRKEFRPIVLNYEYWDKHNTQVS